MIINYIPFRPAVDGKVIPTTATVVGEKLILNGQEIDFSVIGESTILPLTAIDNVLFGGVVSRVNGEVELTVKLAVNADAPYYMWTPGRIDVVSGDVPFPVEPIGDDELLSNISPAVDAPVEAMSAYIPEGISYV